eukprot:gb/GEZN01007320.1/.p1 GENE.gb/GEZN01007320.1/~~gb/GEZN01007320.1/.p1  ORF type:complete len:286 (-),score=20.24 gb/GEZN01007320.1/:128-985(-)
MTTRKITDYFAPAAKRRRLADPSDEEDEIMNELETEQERVFMTPCVQAQMPWMQVLITGSNLISGVTDAVLLVVCSFLSSVDAIRFVTTSKQHKERLMQTVMMKESKRFSKAMRAYEDRLLHYLPPTTSLCFLGVCAGCRLPEWKYTMSPNSMCYTACEWVRHTELIATVHNRYTIPCIRDGRLPCDSERKQRDEEHKRLDNELVALMADRDVSDDQLFWYAQEPAVVDDESYVVSSVCNRCATCSGNMLTEEVDRRFRPKAQCFHHEGVCYSSDPWRAPVYVNP